MILSEYKDRVYGATGDFRAVRIKDPDEPPRVVFERFGLDAKGEGKWDRIAERGSRDAPVVMLPLEFAALLHEAAMESEAEGASAGRFVLTSETLLELLDFLGSVAVDIRKIANGVRGQKRQDLFQLAKRIDAKNDEILGLKDEPEDAAEASAGSKVA